MTLDIDTENKGHPPSAHMLLMIDFDGTIVPWPGNLMDEREAFAGVPQRINRLKEEGFTIGIFTSRVSPTWCKAAGTHPTIQLAYVQRQLMQNGIKYDFVTCEKLPAEAYFDDKAHHVEPGKLADTLDLWRFNRD